MIPVNIYPFKLVVGYKKDKNKYKDVRYALNYTLKLFNDKVNELQYFCILMKGESFSIKSNGSHVIKTKDQVQSELLSKVRTIQSQNGGIVGTDDDIINVCKLLFKMLFEGKRLKELNDWVYLIYGHPSDTKIFSKFLYGSGGGRKELKNTLISLNMFPMFTNMRNTPYKNKYIKNYRFEKMICDIVKSNVKTWNKKLNKFTRSLTVLNTNVELNKEIFNYYKKEFNLLTEYENKCREDAIRKNPNINLKEYSFKLLNLKNIKKYKYICNKFMKCKTYEDRILVVKNFQKKFNNYNYPMDIKFFNWLANEENKLLWRDSLLINVFIKNNRYKYIYDKIKYKFNFTMNDFNQSPAKMSYEIKLNSNMLNYELIFGEGQEIKGELYEKNELYLKIPLFTDITGTVELKDYSIKLNKPKYLDFDKFKSIYRNMNISTDPESKRHLFYRFQTSTLCKIKNKNIDKDSNVIFNLNVCSPRKYYNESQYSQRTPTVNTLCLNFDIDTFLTIYREEYDSRYNYKTNKYDAKFLSSFHKVIHLPGENISEEVKINRENILNEIKEWYYKIKIIKTLYHSKTISDIPIDMIEWIATNCKISISEEGLETTYKTLNKEFNLDFSEWYSNIKNQYIFKRKNIKNFKYKNLNLNIGLSYWGYHFYIELRNLLLNWNQRTKLNLDTSKISNLKFLNDKIKNIANTRTILTVKTLNKLMKELKIKNPCNIIINYVDIEYLKEYNKYNDTNYTYIPDSFKFCCSVFSNFIVDRRHNLNFTLDNIPSYNFHKLTEFDFNPDKTVKQKILNIIKYENLNILPSDLKVGDYIPNKLGDITLAYKNQRIYKYNRNINETKLIVVNDNQNITVKHPYKKFSKSLYSPSRFKPENRYNTKLGLFKCKFSIEYKGHIYYGAFCSRLDRDLNNIYNLVFINNLIQEYDLENKYINNKEKRSKLIFFKKVKEYYIPSSLNHIQEVVDRQFNRLNYIEFNNLCIVRDIYDTSKYQRWYEYNQYMNKNKILIQNAVNSENKNI